jgi:hypothetical protein
VNERWLLNEAEEKAFEAHGHVSRRERAYVGAVDETMIGIKLHDPLDPILVEALVHIVQRRAISPEIGLCIHHTICIEAVLPDLPPFVHPVSPGIAPDGILARYHDTIQPQVDVGALQIVLTQFIYHVVVNPDLKSGHSIRFVVFQSGKDAFSGFHLLLSLHFLLLGFTEARHHSPSHLRWVAATFSHLGHHILHHP